MNIYGPEPPSNAEPAPDNHALKAWLDAQVGLRVLKAGDTMTGELQIYNGGGGIWCEVYHKSTHHLII